MSGNKKKRDERHESLLAIAREMLIKKGLPGLTIEQLANIAGYSRPTVYRHFGSKQAVLDALAERNLALTGELMKKASAFGGSARERVFAMILAYEVMARFHPDEFHMTEFLGMPWVRGNLPEKIGQAFGAMVTSYSNGVKHLVEQAVDDGDLVLRPGMTVGNVVFHSLSMSYGVYTSIIKERVILSLSEPGDPWAEARASLHCFWDGIGWAGTSDQVDYAGVANRFLKEAFPDCWVELEVERLRRDAGLDGD